MGAPHEPRARRPPLRSTYRYVGPTRDHLELDDAELRTLAGLERSLRTSRRARALLALAPLVRWAPSLVPIGTVLMVATIAVSVLVSFAGALLVAVGLAAVLDRVADRVRAIHPAIRRPPAGH